MVTMKTFDPPVDALAGRTVTGVRRVGKHPIVEFGDLTLLIHLMSAGRLQLFDERASLRDKRSRLLVRIADGRELRLREFGTQQRAWAKLLPTGEVDADESLARLGPEAWPPPPLEEFAELIRQPHHLHPLLRDQRTIAGIGRSWVDEILWTAELSPFRQGDDLDDDVGRAAARRGRDRARRRARRTTRRSSATRCPTRRRCRCRSTAARASRARAAARRSRRSTSRTT